MDLSVLNSLNGAISRRNLDECRDALSNISKKSSEIDDLAKLKVELKIRSEAIKIGKDAGSAAEVRELVKFVVSLAEAELCSKALTVTVLQDILDVTSQEKCEEFFSVVDEMIPTWKTAFFFDSCKNSILRMCNDLLKKLSQTVNTSFCGRILILLAKSLSLNDRSGLNLTSQNNTSNATNYDQESIELEQRKPKEDDPDMELGEIRDQNDLTIDFDLYVKFWKLQSYFVYPTKIYSSEKWSSFESGLDEVLSVLSCYKLEKPQISRLEDGNNGSQKKPSEEFSSFSAKYLTSQKLFHLQIADSQFRRYFLVQCIILMNYLANKENKFREKAASPYDPDVLDLSNTELTRLWNINRDNMAACKDRCFAPKLVKFVEDALDEFDPSQQVEEQYMSVNDEKYQFVCSRFLLHSSEHYLETIVPDSTQNNKSVQPTSAVLKAALFNAASHDKELRVKATEIKKSLEEKAVKEKEEEKAKNEAARAAEEAREKEAANARLQEAMNTVKDPIKESPKPKERLEEKRETPKQREKLQRETSKQRETEKEIPQREIKEIKTEIETEKTRRSTKESSVDKLRRSRRSLSNDRDRPPAKAARIDKPKRIKTEEERKSFNDESGHLVDSKRKKK